jgi:hypothetical protein
VGLWLVQPQSQQLIAEGGALVAAAIDPNPAAQYSAGPGDEIGNLMGVVFRRAKIPLINSFEYIYKTKAGKEISTGTSQLVDGILELDFYLPKNLRGKGIGTDMFNNAMKSFGDEIKGIRGLWGHNSAGEASDNLTTFLQNYDYYGGTMSATEAAFSTATGKWAKKNGYTDVKIIFDAADEFEVLFTKPKS